MFYNFRVTCSYREVLCFKASAAVKDSNIAGMGNRLVQVVSDNFDTTISQNCLRSTHSLAMLLAMPETKKREIAVDDAGNQTADNQ